MNCLLGLGIQMSMMVILSDKNCRNSEKYKRSIPLKLIKLYLIDTQQFVEIKNQKSKPLNVKLRGLRLPQGSDLDPS